MRASDRATSYFSGLIIKVNRISKNDSWKAFIREISDHSVKNTGQIHIVRIDPAKYAAGRPLKSFIDSGSLPIVFFTVPIGNVLLVLFYDFNSVVRAAAVQDNEFCMGVLLGNNRQYRVLNKRALVKRRGNNRDFRQRYH